MSPQNMAEYVEARSLAALNALANNPPQYPTNPTESRQEPLTLYISRVPGTRDIILSTFRPQIKNVTAEDVASSLYYIHLSTPDDELLVENSPTSSRPSLDSARSGNAIARKPLRPAPNNPSGLSKVTVPAAQVPNASWTTYVDQPVDQPVGPQAQGLPQDAALPPPPIQRKPVAAREVAAINTQVQPSGALMSEPPPGEIPNLPPRPDEIDSHPDYADPLAPALPIRPENRSLSPTMRKLFTPFTLTLIRRDPSSGQQWNVGKLTSSQLEHPEYVPEGKHVPSPAINVQLETSGYSKFRGMPLPGAVIDLNEIRESLDMVRPGSSGMAAAVNSSPQRQRPRPDLNPSRTSPVAGNVFERQLKMAYAPSWTASLKKAFRRRGSKDNDSAARPARTGHNRYGSANSVGSLGSDFDHSEGQFITVPGHGLNAKGYVFISPWDGKCEFRTGNGGRSLRLRHTLPTHGSQWNPLADGSGAFGGGADGGYRGTGARSPKVRGHDISELRFNLPSSELFSSGDEQSGGNGSNGSNSDGGHHHRPLREGRERTRDRIFNAMINRTEDDIEDDEYASFGGLDLSLGREKAGGGNRGKRAKMGKLIVWDEGLKMLDLVVAANVGVWWNVWERNSVTGSGGEGGYGEQSE